MSDSTLKELWQQVAEKKSCEAKQKELTAQQNTLADRLKKLEKSKLAEQADVNRLEGHSLAAFFYQVIGKMDEKLAAHGGALDTSIEKLLLHKIRVVQAAHPANGEIGILTHFVAELEETTGMTEVRVVCRGNRVFQRRMVRQGHMEAGYACPFQQWHENRQFFFYKVTKLKLFL